jgi:Putative phage holin Dp-1
MTLKNGVYNVTKWIAQIALPAFGTLYVALAAIWNLRYPTQVANTVLAVDTFLGVLLGISSASYKPVPDGKLLISQPTPETATARMEFNTHPEDIISSGKKYMTLAILPDPGQANMPVTAEIPGPAKQVKSYD